jgi:hypothetical protein
LRSGLFGAAAGIAYMPFVADDVTTAQAIRFAAQGAIIVLLTFGFELFVAQGPASERLRQAPFVVVLISKTLITTALIVIAYVIGGLLLFPDRFAENTALRSGQGYWIRACRCPLVAVPPVGARACWKTYPHQYHSRALS